MKRKNIIIGIIVIVAILIGAAAIYGYKMYGFYKSFLKTQTMQVDKDLTVILGGGGNSALLVTDSAVVVIDTKLKGPAEELYKLAKEKAGQKKIIVINTHYHMDHTGGNQYYKGCKIYIGDYDRNFLVKNLKPEQMPTDYVKDSVILNLGNETLKMFNLGQAHTSNDMVVYLKNRKILISGDLVFDNINPVLKKESNSNVDKWIAVLNIILHKWDIDKLVPGHGKINNKDIANNLKEYFIDMRTAAENPDKEKEIIAKYKNWMTMPSMASPERTIKYIRNNK